MAISGVSFTISRRSYVVVVCTLFIFLAWWHVGRRFSPLGREEAASKLAPLQRPSVELVVSSVSSDNTSWINEYFPHYLARIYIADNLTAPLHVQRNVGHESNVYLTYVAICEPIHA
jgi:hypothetical protein